MRCVLFVWVFLTLETALGSFRAVWPGMPSLFQRGFFRELEPPVDVVSAILSCDSDGFEDPPRVHLPRRRRGVPGLACSFSSASAGSLPSASLLEELTSGGGDSGSEAGVGSVGLSGSQTPSLRASFPDLLARAAVVMGIPLPLSPLRRLITRGSAGYSNVR